MARRRNLLHLLRALVLAALWFTGLAVAAEGEVPDVKVIRVPGGGIQPDVARDDEGVLHMIYFRGAPAAGDVFYTRSGDDGASFRAPLRVNSQPGSVVAIGTVRGAQLAVGRAGRIHVAWMGSKDAAPRAPGGGAPMRYSRLSEEGGGFEPQRNLIRKHPGLGGGGSVAAARRGNVWVAWHAPSEPGIHDEARRRVFVADARRDAPVPLFRNSARCG